MTKSIHGQALDVLGVAMCQNDARYHWSIASAQQCLVRESQRFHPVLTPGLLHGIFTHIAASFSELSCPMAALFRKAMSGIHEL